MSKFYGHRGSVEEYPENTLISFLGAYSNKMDGIELDIHMTKDNELVVIHDERLERTTDGIGFIRDYTFKELRKYSAGKGYSKKFNKERIPSLIEVFELFENKDFEINIEIKLGGRFYPNIEKKLIEYINKYYRKDKIIISSFDHYSLVKCKEIDNSLKTGALTASSLYEPWEYLNNLKVDYYHPHFITLTDEFLQESKKRGVLINTYTVDDKKSINNLVDKDVNIIITNRKIVDKQL